MMSEWIDTKEEKPKKDECVDIWIVADGGYHQGDAGRLVNFFYDESEDKFWCFDDYDGVLCIDKNSAPFWIRQPEPPEGFEYA